MLAGSVSRRYARGIFELAKEAGQLPRVSSELEGFDALLKGNDELAQLFSSPTYSADVKGDVLKSLLAGKVHRLTLNFLMLLAKRHRMDHFGEIIREFNRLRDLDDGIVRVHMSSAVELSTDIEEKLVSQLGTMIGKNIAVTKEVDPALIGGIVTQVGHMVFDGSLATQFSKIRRHLESGEGV